jgi:hypothetical protein
MDEHEDLQRPESSARDSKLCGEVYLSGGTYETTAWNRRGEREFAEAIMVEVMIEEIPRSD